MSSDVRRYDMRLSLQILTLLALCLSSAALASPETVARKLGDALRGVEQTCPPEYAGGTCVKVTGGLVETISAINDTLPELSPNFWEDSPEGGQRTTLEEGATMLHVIREGQSGDGTLLVLQSVPSQVTGTPEVQVNPDPVVDNPDKTYFVVLDARKQVVLNLSTVRGGVYTLVASAHARVTRTDTLTVGATGLTRLVIPKLQPTSSMPGTGSIELPQAPGYLFLIIGAQGQVITDISALQPGYYTVLSYRNGTVGPTANLTFVSFGQVAKPDFNASFVGAPAQAIPTSSAPTFTAPASPAPSLSTPGQCYVSGYTRKNGTRVSGYYRRC